MKLESDEDLLKLCVQNVLEEDGYFSNPTISEDELLKASIGYIQAKENEQEYEWAEENDEGNLHSVIAVCSAFKTAKFIIEFQHCAMEHERKQKGEQQC